jgi:hypothetical protein
MKVADNERMPSREEVSEAVNPRARNPEMEQEIPRTRTPFGSGRLRLGVTKIPGYHMHWIRNDPGRLEDAEANGYEYVTKSEVRLSRTSGADSAEAGERVSRISPGAQENGQPTILHLMKIREEWFRENQEFYLARSRAVEQQIKTGKIDGMRRPETYHPKGSHISIDTKLE